MSEIDVRSKIYQTISSLKAIDEEEQLHISFALEWLKSGKEIFRIEKPTIPDIHLVSYFLITFVFYQTSS